MADVQGRRQTQTGSTAPPGESRDIRSADAVFSVNETKRLQKEAQQRINANQHYQIGSQP